MKPANRVPNSFIPMLATLADFTTVSPSDRDLGFEYKWDGIRALFFFEKSRRGAPHIRIETRNQHDVTAVYPELAAISSRLLTRGHHHVVLDGEIVAFNRRGRPDFEMLQHRLGVSGAMSIAQAKADVPIIYMIFDIVALDGRDLMSQPYRERRRILESLKLHGSSWLTPPMQIGDGKRMFAAARQRGLEGVVAKRLDSKYQPGIRGRDWLKIKLHEGQELVIGGFTRGAGARKGSIGALLVGYNEKSAGKKSQLHFAGRVGTGYSEGTLRMLERKLRPLITKRNPFVEDPRLARGRGRILAKEDFVFVRPKLVGQFSFAQWTRNHTLRQPSFKGLRIDKQAPEVVREIPRLR